MVEGLGRLKRRFILATLSNGNVALMVNLAKHAGLPWDAILGAEIARAYKPDAVVYDRAAELLDLATGASMMVAAHPSDLAGAAGRGFRTAFVPRPAEHGPGGTAEAPHGRKFDVTAKDFCELAAKLGC